MLTAGINLDAIFAVLVPEFDTDVTRQTLSPCRIQSFQESFLYASSLNTFLFISLETLFPATTPAIKLVKPNPN